MFRPKLLDLFSKGYSRQSFLGDLSAGLIVGIVAIPLAVAFAIASGVSPDKGLLTAVIAGFLISALGGSSVQIGGPTGAFIVIIYGILSRYGMDGLLLATLMAGVFLVLLGAARLGVIIQYIPFPVIVGFTSGIAVIIFSSQINDFFGLGLRNLPADFLEKWAVYFEHWAQVNGWALGLSLGTIAVIVGLQKLDRRLPGALVALVAATVLVQVFGWPVETIGSRFGTVAGGIPLPGLPAITWDRLQELLMPALSIALLAGIESLLSAVVADGMIGRKHDSNTELIAQGLANIASALFGGIPATGAIARTATNVKSGGRSPVAGIIHAVFLLGVLLFLSPLTGLIPLAALAGILAVVSYNMSEHRTFISLFKGPRSDVLTLVATFLLTVLLDLTVAIPLGILLALLGFLRRMSQAGQVTRHEGEVRELSEDLDPFGLARFSVPEGIEVYEISGPFFFGAAERFKEAMLLVENPPKVRILRMRQVPSIDASGLTVLKDLVHNARQHRTQLVFSGVQPAVRAALDKWGLSAEVGPDNVIDEFPAALERAKALLGRHGLSLAEKLGRGGVRTLAAPSPAAVLQALTEGLPVLGVPKGAVLASLNERESMAPTALGEGLALPHPRSPLLKYAEDELIALAYLDPPVDWQAADGLPVRVAVLILASSVESHLKTLTETVRWLRRPETQALLERRAGLADLTASLRPASAPV